VISKKWKSRIALLIHNAWRLYSDGLARQNPARLALPETRPNLFEKIPRRIFELNEAQTNPEARNTKTSKLQPKNQQDTACRIELADLGLQFRLVTSMLPLPPLFAR